MKIRIQNVRLRTIVGVYEHERKHKQDVVINVELDYDGARAAETDRLEDAVDYAAIKLRILELVSTSRFQLLEALAERILRAVLDDAKVQSATVEVAKPGALRFCDAVSVCVSRQRE